MALCGIFSNWKSNQMVGVNTPLYDHEFIIDFVENYVGSTGILNKAFLCSSQRRSLCIGDVAESRQEALFCGLLY